MTRKVIIKYVFFFFLPYIENVRNIYILYTTNVLVKNKFPEKLGIALNISKCSFKTNSAELQGGAIKFTSKTPILMSNTFKYNKAVYGGNIAGHPLRIRIFNKTLASGEMYRLSEQVSGTILTQSILFEIVDEFEQRITNLAGLVQ